MKYLYVLMVCVLVSGGCASQSSVTSSSSTSTSTSTSKTKSTRGISGFVDAEVLCLAQSIYFEARGESNLGQLAVGSVVLNRVRSNEFPGTVCAVVRQGGETPPCQFSWWCDGKSDRPNELQAWRSSYQLAERILSQETKDPTHGALYFHSTAVNPGWSLRRIGRIGAHVFYQ